jgi:hypothetical protein
MKNSKKNSGLRAWLKWWAQNSNPNTAKMNK